MAKVKQLLTEQGCVDSKLLPCPFCGGDAELRAESTRNRYKFVAGCCECPAIAGGSAFENKEYNTKAWNTRATSSKEAAPLTLEERLMATKQINPKRTT